MKYISAILCVLSFVSCGAMQNGKDVMKKNKDKIVVIKESDKLTQVSLDDNNKSTALPKDGTAQEDATTQPDPNSCSTRCANSQCCMDCACLELECLSSCLIL
jgi:hypothetical protein